MATVRRSVNPRFTLERRFGLEVPVVRLSQDKQWLMWEVSDGDEPMPHPGMEGALESFVRITRGKDQSFAKVANRVLRVAKRYGPLYLCKHRQPANHDEKCLIDRELAGTGSEPVQRWQALAETLGGLISFAGMLTSADKFEDVSDHPIGRKVAEYSGGLVIEKTDSGTFIGPGPLLDPSRGYSIPVTLADARSFVEERVRELIVEAGIVPSVQWNEDKHQFDFGFEEGSHGLYGTVVLQTALTMGGATRWLRCDSCQSVYFRSTKRNMPGRSRFNYCEDCDRPDIKRSIQRRRAKGDSAIE